LEVINTIKGKQMNNPLAQKYNYYLNESYRLSEELKSEKEYIEFLENFISQTTSLEQLEEQLRSSVNPRTGAYTRGFIRRIGSAIGLARPISLKHENQQDDIHRQIDHENHNSEIDDIENASKTRNANFDAKQKHAAELKNWQAKKEKHGTVRPDIDVDERIIRANHKAGQAGFDYRGASGKTRSGGQWHDAEDEVQRQKGLQADRNRANASAHSWLKDNPEPKAPEQALTPERKVKRLKMFGDNKPKE
jgi:hypothetical protein